MEFDGSAFEVEFSQQDGTTYAMETITATKLMLLHQFFMRLHRIRSPLAPLRRQGGLIVRGECMIKEVIKSAPSG